MVAVAEAAAPATRARSHVMHSASHQAVYAAPMVQEAGATLATTAMPSAGVVRAARLAPLVAVPG